MESSSWGSQHDLVDVGFGESVKDSTSKFILRFVERVCIEAGVTAQHLRSLTQNIPSRFFRFFNFFYDTHTKFIASYPNKT